MESQDLEDQPPESLITYTQEDYDGGKIIFDAPSCWDCVCCNSNGVIAVAGKTSVHLYSPQIQHQYFFATSWIKIEFVEEVINAGTTVSESDVAWLASHGLNENAMYLKQICWFEMPNQQPILLILTNTGQLFGFVEDSLSFIQSFNLDYITRTVKIQANGFRMIISPLAFGESGDYILHDCFDVVCGRRNMMVSSSETDVYVWELAFTSTAIEDEKEGERTLVPHRRSSLDMLTHIKGQVGSFVKIAICFDDDDRLSVVCANRWGSCYFLTTTGGEDLALTVVRTIDFEGSLECVYLSSRLLLVVSSVCMLAIQRTAAACSNQLQKRVASPHTKAMTSIKSTHSSFIGRDTHSNSSEEGDCFVSCSLDGSIYWWRLPTTPASTQIIIHHQMHLPHAEFGYYGITADPLDVVYFTVHRQPVQNDNSREVQLNSQLTRPHLMLSYHIHYSLSECILHDGKQSEGEEEATSDDLTVILTQASSLLATNKQHATASHVVLSLWLLFLQQRAHFARLPIPPKPLAMIAREEFIYAQQHQASDDAQDEEKGEAAVKLLSALELNKVRRKAKQELRDKQEKNKVADNDEKESDEGKGDEKEEEAEEEEDVGTSDSEASITIRQRQFASKKHSSSSSTPKKAAKKTSRNSDDSDDDDIQSRASIVNQASQRYGFAELINVLRDYMPPTFVQLAEIASERLLQSCCRALCQLSSDTAPVSSISDLSVDALLSSGDPESMQKILTMCLLTHVTVLSFHQIADQPLLLSIRQQVDDLQHKMSVIHAVQALTQLNQVLSKDQKEYPSLLQWTMLDRWLQFLSSIPLQHSRTIIAQSEGLRQSLARKWRQQLSLLKDRCFVCNDIILFDTNTVSHGTCMSCAVTTERCPFTLMLATTAIDDEDNIGSYHVPAEMMIACPVCKTATNMQVWKQYQIGIGDEGEEEVAQCPYCAVVMKQLMT